MARPRKWRNVCSLPESNRFGPLDSPETPGKLINMTVDEYECIRLIDLQGLNQAECAEQMGVARTTVQGIYAKARVKLAKSLISGKTLTIGGGEYELCDGLRSGCGQNCNRHASGRGHGQGRGRNRVEDLL